MHRRDVNKLLAAHAVAPVLVPAAARAQTCESRDYPKTAAESAAAVNVIDRLPVSGRLAALRRRSHRQYRFNGGNPSRVQCQPACIRCGGRDSPRFRDHQDSFRSHGARCRSRGHSSGLCKWRHQRLHDVGRDGRGRRKAQNQRDGSQQGSAHRRGRIPQIDALRLQRVRDRGLQLARRLDFRFRLLHGRSLPLP